MPEINGTAASDSLTGSSVNDTISGLEGDDLIDGLQGDDSISAGDGADEATGNFGNDTVSGDAGNDTLRGHDGNDLLIGDSNADGSTATGDGDDLLLASVGNDTLIGNGGNDWLLGQEDSDLLFGNEGDDRLEGGDANDTLDGGDGDDTLDGGEGDDSISAGDGADEATGNFGNDTVSGDAGNDTLRGHDGNDLLIGDSNADGSTATGDGDDLLLASVGNDTLIGNGGNDWLRAQEDSDLLFGNEGDDRLEGGDANDTLDGGEGNDLLLGGRDDNLLTGGEGFDTIGLLEADGADTVTDFNTGTGQDFADGDQSNNDFVDLGTDHYNAANLALYNSANGTSYATPLEWLRADQADDGVLNMLDGSAGLPMLNLSLQNGGAAVAAGDLTFDNTNVICFSGDALIATAQGEVEAIALAVGDLVCTRDCGLQPIRWIGRRSLSATELRLHPKLRPIRISAGALGPGLPSRDLAVSPQHRILIRSRIAQKMFGTDEVLVAAKQLCQFDGVDIAEDLDAVTYVHFLCDAHQIVLANGLETESLYTGAEALKSVGPQAREEIFALFPELRDLTEPLPARHMASGRMGRKLAVRHLQNRKPLIGPVPH